MVPHIIKIGSNSPNRHKSKATIREIPFSGVDVGIVAVYTILQDNIGGSMQNLHADFLSGSLLLLFLLFIDFIINHLKNLNKKKIAPTWISLPKVLNKIAIIFIPVETLIPNFIMSTINILYSYQEVLFKSIHIHIPKNYQYMILFILL